MQIQKKILLLYLPSIILQPPKDTILNFYIMAGGKKTAADAKAATTNADPALAAQILCALVSGNSHNHSADPEDAKEVVSKAYAIAEAFATHE